MSVISESAEMAPAFRPPLNRYRIHLSVQRIYHRGPCPSTAVPSRLSRLIALDALSIPTNPTDSRRVVCRDPARWPIFDTEPAVIDGDIGADGLTPGSSTS